MIYWHMDSIFRPQGFYDVLRNPQAVPQQERRLARRSNAYALRGTPPAPELDHKMPNLRPSRDFFRTKEYVTSAKPAVTASSKGPAPSGGGGSGGGAMLKALQAMMQSSPVPSRPSTLGGNQKERGYTYG